MTQTRPSLIDTLLRLPSEERPDFVRQRGPLQDVLPQLLEEAGRLIAVGTVPAMDATAAVLELVDRIGSARDRAQARRARARALASAGRFDEALLTCGEAITLADQAGDRVESGRSRLASMHPLCELGRMDEAIQAGSAARDILIEVDEQLAARADINLGVAHHRADQPAQALLHLDRARPVLLDHPDLFGALESNRGEALVALNDFPAAEQAFEAALNVFTTRGHDLHAGIAEGNLADLAFQQGRLHSALERFEHARRRFENAGSENHRARLLAEQADAKALLGLLEDARGEYETALRELEQCGLVLEAARARRGLGLVLLNLQRPAEADAMLAEAAETLQQLDQRPSCAKVDLIRADIAAQRGAVDEALTLGRAAQRELVDRPADAAFAHSVMAGIYLEMDDLDAAEREADAGFALASELQLAPLQADLLRTRSRILSCRGETEAAIAELREAVRHVERVRGMLQAERFRSAFLGERSGIYEDLVDAILDNDAPDAVGASFDIAEHAKSRSLLEQARGDFDLEDTAREHLDADETALLDRLTALRSELNAHYSRLAHDGRRVEPDDTGAWLSMVAGHERQIDDIETRLESTGHFSGMFANPASMAEVRGQLADGEALIEYFATGDDMMAFVMTRETAHVFRGLVNTNELRDRVHRLRFQIDIALRPSSERPDVLARRTQSAQRELSALYDVLIRPFKDRIADCTRLTIVPHGNLHQIPFHALYDGTSYLVEHYETHVLPNASLLKTFDHSPRLDGARALVVGVPEASVPLIEEEAIAVAKQVGGSALIGSEATVDRFRSESPTADIIHLACHGRHATTSAKGSGLKLHDRWLTVRDIYQLHMRARLVTLSGCETGMSLVTAGDELVGLTRAFLATGVKSLLVSLWRVQDRNTQYFMRDFYEHWYDGSTGGSASALRHAQLKSIERCAHPAYWAPFVLVGDPR